MGAGPQTDTYRRWQKEGDSGQFGQCSTHNLGLAVPAAFFVVKYMPKMLPRIDTGSFKAACGGGGGGVGLGPFFD